MYKHAREAHMDVATDHEKATVADIVVTGAAKHATNEGVRKERSPEERECKCEVVGTRNATNATTSIAHDRSQLAYVTKANNNKNQLFTITANMNKGTKRP